ncbi:MAG: SurA N-terminal domain-containing protein [Pseudomonadota bacterium]
MPGGIRSKGANIFVYVLLGLLVVGLAGFSIGDFGASIRAIGQVGDVEIDVNDYHRELQQELNAAQAQTGQPVTMAEARQFGLDQAVLERLIGQAALDNETQAMGLSVSDETVREAVLQIPAFRGLDGTFDRESYQGVLDRQGLTVAQFEDRVRSDAARGILQRAVADGVATPEFYVDTLMRFLAERRSFVWSVLHEDMLDTPPDIPDATALRTYYDANPEAFTMPERREITYVWLIPDMLVDTIERDEAQLRQMFEERDEEYQQPERRLVERLVFPDTATAAAAKAAIERGESRFEDSVRARGLTMDDVDLGDVARTDLNDEAATAVFGLDGPGLVGPVDTNLGPALFQVNAVLEAQSTTFEEVADELHAEIAQDRARRSIDDSVAEIDDLLAGGATLEEIAQETEMLLGHLDWTADVEAGIAGYDAFRAAARAATVDDFPELVRLSDDGIFALRLDGIAPPALQPLEDVRIEVAQAAQADALRRALRAKAETLLPRLAAGEPFENLDLEARIEDDLNRDAFIEGAPPALLTEIFKLGTGEATIVEDGERIALARLRSVLPPDDTDEDLAQLSRFLDARIRQGLSQDILAAYTDALQTRAGIRLNRQAIDAVHAQHP